MLGPLRAGRPTPQWCLDLTTQRTAPWGPASILGLLPELDGPESPAASSPAWATAPSWTAGPPRRPPRCRRAAWRDAEDRYASDLLLPDLVGDPWLRALTNSPAAAAIPVLLVGDTPVGPGPPLLAERLG